MTVLVFFLLVLVVTQCAALKTVAEAMGEQDFVHELCLSIIVRDEAKVIRRFLQNNRFVADHVDLVDTGSSDDTIALAEAFFAANDLNGTVHHFPWIDHFGKARTAALDASRRSRCRWAIFLDADEEVLNSATGKLLQSPSETRELARLLNSQCVAACQLKTKVDGDLNWWRFFALNLSRNATWRGARHEYLHGEIDPIINLVGFGVYARRDQSRLGRNKNALLYDVLALEHDVLEDLDVPRSLYYVGQSYEQARCRICFRLSSVCFVDNFTKNKQTLCFPSQAGLKREALAAYERRVARDDGWIQEKFYAQLRVAGTAVFVVFFDVFDCRSVCFC